MIEQSAEAAMMRQVLKKGEKKNCGKDSSADRGEKISTEG
jgi:hypothetical protein